jgi:hypothetical protein
MTKMEDPILWGQNLWISYHPVMNNFDLCEVEIRKTYGDNDQEINVAVWGYQAFDQEHHDTEVGVWAYAI